MQKVKRHGCSRVDEEGLCGRSADSALELVDDLDKGDASVPGEKDHCPPLAGRAMVGSPFGIFQGREEFCDGPQEGDEHHGVGRADMERRRTP